MQITKLVLDNFSSYEGKNIFDFTVKKDKPIILIGGQNGAGKTSIFTAIKIALYGPLAFGYTGNNSFYSSFSCSNYTCIGGKKTARMVYSEKRT